MFTDMSDDELFAPTENQNTETEANTGEQETTINEPAQTKQAEQQGGSGEGVKTDENSENQDPKKQDGENGEESKPKGRASERIAQLVQERNRERERATQLERKLAQYNPQQQANQQSNVNTSFNQLSNQPAGLQEPDPTQFDFGTQEGVDAYFQASEQYRQHIEQQKQEQLYQEFVQRQQAEQTEKQIMADFQAKASADPKFKEDFKNFQEWMGDKPLAADISQLYQGADLVDVIAEIAGNADLYYELAGMSEQQQYAKYGEIHTVIQSRKQSQTPPQKHTKAPKPANHGGTNAPVKRSEYDMSDDEFLRARGLA